MGVTFVLVEFVDLLGRDGRASDGVLVSHNINVLEVGLVESGLVESSTGTDAYGHDDQFVEVVMVDGHSFRWFNT